jgi:hypothetical protein
MKVVKAVLAKIQSRAFAPVDIASLIFFRFAFGLLMLCEVWILRHQIAASWINPRFLFKYYGFSWVQPWGGNGLYIHWYVMGVFALFIAIGFFYRLSAALFCLSYTYFFLLDEGRYVNHAYLICLFSFLLIFVPAHRTLSLDSWLRPKIRSQTVPAWALWLFRMQMAAVYFFAGIAKIAPDWLRGEPMRTWLTHSIHSPLVDRFSHEVWAPYVASYTALLVDLLAAPLLFWRRTRVAAFCLVVVFHLLNAQFFPIGIFPWLAIAATTLFLSPSWPRQIISVFRPAAAPAKLKTVKLPPKRPVLILSSAAVYTAIQILVPSAHFFYPGGIEWTYLEHHFSWQMLLRQKTTTPFFYATDPNSDETHQIKLREYMDQRQTARMGWRPDMVQQFARYLATVTLRSGPKPLKVQVRMFVSINGRKPQLFIDPNVDLVAESRCWGRPRWLLQIHEPLPDHPVDSTQRPFESSQ